MVDPRASGRGFDTYLRRAVSEFEQRHIYTKKSAKRWLRPDMTEKLFTGKQTNKQTALCCSILNAVYLFAKT